MLVRGKSLEATMSRYLINRINAQHNIEVITETEVSALEGENGRLQTVRWRHRRTGEETARPIPHVFLFIGAEPNANWLKPYGIAVDAKGFICTNIGENARPLETSQPGVFAIGDVRSNSVKRVASAVGEGAQVIATIHTYLAETRESSAKPEAAHG
jgi:thioredoxin reductase (NADPH)